MLVYTTHVYQLSHAHARHIGKRMHQCVVAGAEKVGFRIHRDTRTIAVSIGRVIH
jgi:hypothetical protein